MKNQPSEGHEIDKALRIENALKIDIHLPKKGPAVVEVVYQLTEENSKELAAVLKKFHLVPIKEESTTLKNEQEVKQ